MTRPPKEPRVVWFPSEEGIEFGIEEGTPLWGELIAPRLTEQTATPPEEAVKTPRRKGTRQVGDELTPQKRANRVAALSEFYSDPQFGGAELPYEGGEWLDPPEMITLVRIAATGISPKWEEEGFTTPQMRELIAAVDQLDPQAGYGPDHAPPVKGNRDPLRFPTPQERGKRLSE